MMASTDGVAAVRARLGLIGEIKWSFSGGRRPGLRIGNGPMRSAPARELPPVGDPTVCELIASSYPADLLQDADLGQLATAVPLPLRQRWAEHPDAVSEVARQVLTWTVAPLTERGLLVRLATADDLDKVNAAERYASHVASPIRLLAADIGALVRRAHEPHAGAMGAAVRQQLGDTLAALVPPTVLERDDSVPSGWAAVRAGACLLGWCPADELVDAMVSLVRENAWRLLTVRQISAALTSFGQRPDSAHIEWFARQLYTDEEITWAIRQLLFAGHPVTSLPVFLREIAYTARNDLPIEERFAIAVANLDGFVGSV